MELLRRLLKGTLLMAEVIKEILIVILLLAVLATVIVMLVQSPEQVTVYLREMLQVVQ